MKMFFKYLVIDILLCILVRLLYEFNWLSPIYMWFFMGVVGGVMAALYCTYYMNNKHKCKYLIIFHKTGFWFNKLDENKTKLAHIYKWGLGLGFIEVRRWR